MIVFFWALLRMVAIVHIDLTQKKQLGTLQIHQTFLIRSTTISDSAQDKQSRKQRIILVFSLEIHFYASVV